VSHPLAHYAPTHLDLGYAIYIGYIVVSNYDNYAAVRAHVFFQLDNGRSPLGKDIDDNER